MTEMSIHQCEQDLGYDANGDYRGFCADIATIRCNACGKYFCEECWQDHLEMTVEIAQKGIEQ
jgi:hypothetical protein